VSLENPFAVYGATGVSGAWVYIEDTTSSEGIVKNNTEADGSYVIDIQDYATNGDTIKVWVFTANGLYNSDSFTLDTSTPAKNVDLTPAVISISDNPTVSDSFARTASYIRSLSDNPTVSDSISILATYLRSLSDNPTVSDSFARTATYTRSISDNPTVSDSFAVTTAYKRNISDNPTVSDSVSIAAAYARAITDNVSVSDSFSRTQDHTLSISDIVSITDSIFIRQTFPTPPGISYNGKVLATTYLGRTHKKNYKGKIKNDTY